jgi:uncharacterized cupredoxin-like copper-binding protein
MPQRRRSPARRIRPWGTLVSAAALSVLLATACSGDSSAADGATVINVSLGRFVIDPETLQAPAGTIVLKVTNDDPDLVHDLVAYGKGTRPLKPGQSQTLEIPAVLAGQYRVWCDQPGHAARGQVAALVVTPAATTTPASA